MINTTLLDQTVKNTSASNHIQPFDKTVPLIDSYNPNYLPPAINPWNSFDGSSKNNYSFSSTSSFPSSSRSLFSATAQEFSPSNFTKREDKDLIVVSVSKNRSRHVVNNLNYTADSSMNGNYSSRMAMEVTPQQNTHNGYANSNSDYNNMHNRYNSDLSFHDNNRFNSEWEVQPDDMSSSIYSNTSYTNHSLYSSYKDYHFKGKDFSLGDAWASQPTRAIIHINGVELDAAMLKIAEIAALNGKISAPSIMNEILVDYKDSNLIDIIALNTLEYMLHKYTFSYRLKSKLMSIIVNTRRRLFHLKTGYEYIESNPSIHVD